MKIAIVGASKNRDKFGNKAVRAYKKNDHVVFPVNPNERMIEGLICYGSLIEIPLEIDVVSIYLPPEIGIKITNDIIKKKVKKVFLNSGAESIEIKEKLESNKIEVLEKCSIRDIGIDPATL